LRQDPVENLFAFICSANNNIQRISGMVQNMSKEYGEHCGELEGESHYAFPSLSSLAKSGVEERLRELGFGYRARYIEESARKILPLNDQYPIPATKRDLGTPCLKIRYPAIFKNALNPLNA